MKRFILALFFLVLGTWAPDAPAQTGFAAVPNRVLGPIDETELVTLKGNVHPLAQPQFDRGPAAASEPTGRINLLLRRSTTQEQALTQYLSDLENPSSAIFHKWLTPAQYGGQFGVDNADIQTAESWLQSHGFRIEKVPASLNRIEFSGTIDQVQIAFHTSIHAFDIDGETRFANVTDPQIPAALAPVIAGVGPLSNFRSRRGAIVRAKGKWNPATQSIEPDLTLFGTNSTPYLFVDPADAATIYDTPNSVLNPAYTAGTSYTGTGATIGIVGTSNLYTGDILNYRTGFLGESTATANLPTVIVDGNDPGIQTNGAGVEALLDNEVAGGLAPGAKIDFYISAGSDLSDGLFNAVFRAIDDNAIDILSISFSACESAMGTSGNQLILETSEQAAAQGISVTVSAGDNGSAGCDDFDTATAAQSGLAVSGFASTPYNIAVGGTDFDVLPSSFSTYASNTTRGSPPYYRTATRYIPEEPWNDSTTTNSTISQNSAYRNTSHATNIIAGSGGVSNVYAKPAFQSALTPADGHRDLPDVSLLAGNGFYSALWVVCSDTVANGTSSSSPSSDCSNSTGQFNSSSTFTGVGGTSASAPAFAGMLALAVQATGGRLGQADTVLYQLANAHPTCFHDITSGDNSVPCISGSPACGSNGFLTGYNAGTGYDFATGLGSVDAATIVNNWKSVSLGPTSTTLQINGSSAAYSGVHGANLTFSSGVTGSNGTPTGVVAITDNASLTAGGTASGPQNNGQVAIPLNSGSGSVAYNGLPGGNYAVTAQYGGDTTFASSTSTPIAVSISAEPSTTALTVDAYNPSTSKTIPSSNVPYGSYVFLDAAISGTAEGSNTQGVATGTVKFSNNGTVFGSGTLSSDNEASWPPQRGLFAALPVGSNMLTAQYSGDASFNASTSSAVPLTIVQGSTSIAVPSAEPYSGNVGLPITLSTTLTTTSAGAAPTGTVTFLVGSTSLGSAALSGAAATNSALASGTVSFTTSALPAGSDSITAVYNGDTNYLGATSAAYSISISKTLLSGLNIVPNPSTVAENQPLNITVAAVQPAGAPIPTGSVTLTYRAPNFVNVPANLSSGSVTFTIPANTFSPGPQDFSAAYSGDSNYQPTSNSFLYFEVTPSGTITPVVTVTGPSAPVSSYPFTVTVTVSGSSGKPTPTGTVEIASSLYGGYLQLSNGSASQSFPGQEPVGNDTVTATYYGDANYIGGSGSTNVIIQAFPAITFSPTPLSTAINQALNVTVSVTGAGVNLPTATGTMILSSGSYSSSAISLSNGSASITIPANAFTVGAQTLTATYSGDTYHRPGSNTTTVTVTAAQPSSFSMNATAAGTVSPGSSATSTITVTPSGGFTGAVNLTCSVNTGSNDPPTCSVPGSVTIPGTTAATATLTIYTTAPTSAALERPLHNKFLAGGGGFTLAIVFFFAISAQRRARRLLLSVFTLVFIGAAVSCGGGGGGGGGGNPGTTAGNYTVTVTGKDAATGQITAATTATLTVN